MPSIKQHQSTTTLKTLFIGDSGAGKTGALASLAAAGYKLRILDCDNGLDVLANLLNDPKSPYPKNTADNIHYITVQEPTKVQNGRPVIASATAWQKAMNSLQSWKEPGDAETPPVDFGPVTSWGPDTILVIDSLSLLSRYALNLVLAMNARLNQHPQLQDWGAGQSFVESFLSLVTNDQIRCHVIICCHLTYIGGGENSSAPVRAYPRSLGKSLPPKTGEYFNNALMAQTRGQGANQKRRILTNTTGVVELKNSAPLRVKPEYDLSTGLADYFRDVLGHGPESSEASRTLPNKTT